MPESGDDNEGRGSPAGLRGLNSFSKGLGTSFRSQMRRQMQSPPPSQPMSPQAGSIYEDIETDVNPKDEMTKAVALEGGYARLLNGENFYPLISGVLAVKVVHGELVHGVYQENNLIIVRIRVRNSIKYTDQAKYWGSKLTWAAMSYFPMHIVHNPRHPFNLVQIDVLQIPAHQSFSMATKDPANIIGSIPFHVHDLVRGSPSNGNYTVMQNHRNVGSLTLEFYFTYGSLGFGYSSQMNSEESPETILEYSMLPRCKPEAHCDDWSQTLSVPSREAYGEILDEKTHRKKFPLVHARMKRFYELREHYKDIDQHSRIDRLVFLHKQLNDTTLNESKCTPPVFDHVMEVTSTKAPSFFQKFMRPTIPIQVEKARHSIGGSPLDGSQSRSSGHHYSDDIV